MVLFWLIAAVLSAAVAAAMLRAAARARGTEQAGGRAAPLLCCAAPLLAGALYVAVGSPGLPDQPHARRVEAWRRAPESIGPAQAAAVLERIVAERPRDAVARTQLGRARLASGDAFGAVRALEEAVRLAPGEAGSWTAMIQALLALDPPAVAEARRALNRAASLAPGDPDVRYWSGRIAVADGDVTGGVAQWRALQAALPREDPRWAALGAEIAKAQGAAAPVDAAIAGMVEGLAARLREQPDDPEGWARLVRAYAVLGRERDLRSALTEARRLFAGRPDVLQAIEAGVAEGRARSPLRAGG